MKRFSTNQLTYGRTLSTFIVGAVVGQLLFSSAAHATPIFFCDLNDDQISDLVIGAPNEDTVNPNPGPNDDPVWEDGGSVSLYQGQSRGALEFGEQWVGRVDNFQFGQTVLCLDINLDGFDDLFFGVPFASDEGKAFSGLVWYVMGSATGHDVSSGRFVGQSSLNIVDDPEIGDAFGAELDYGFFDNDQFPDLVVSSPGETLRGIKNAGQVHIIFGASDGLAERSIKVSQQSKGIQDRPETDDFFGASLASGDFDGDGWWDLAVGVPQEDVNGKENAGAINIIYGNATGLSRRDQFLHQDRISMQDSAEPFDYFGAPLWAADVVPPFQGARMWDLIVGVPSEDLQGHRDAGAVHVIAGTRNGLRGKEGEFWHRGRRGIRDVLSAGDEFGHAIMVGQFDGDGSVDLAVGVPGDDRGAQNSGSIHLLFGDNDGLSTRDKVLHQNTKNFPMTAKQSDRLGMTFAAGDFNGDGVADLAAGLPLKDRLGVRDSGAAVILFGHGRFGLRAKNSILLDQFLPERRDNFGNFSKSLACCQGLEAVRTLVAQPVSVQRPVSVGPR